MSSHKMMTRVLSKEELMILLRIKPYTTLAEISVMCGSYVCHFKDSGPICETVPPDFLLGRMLLKSAMLLTTKIGIVGVTNYSYSVAGKSIYDSKRISLEEQKLVQSLRPLFEEAMT